MNESQDARTIRGLLYYNVHHGPKKGNETTGVGGGECVVEPKRKMNRMCNAMRCDAMQSYGRVVWPPHSKVVCRSVCLLTCKIPTLLVQGPVALDLFPDCIGSSSHDGRMDINGYQSSIGILSRNPIPQLISKSVRRTTILLLLLLIPPFQRIIIIIIIVVMIRTTIRFLNVLLLLLVVVTAAASRCFFLLRYKLNLTCILIRHHAVRPLFHDVRLIQSIALSLLRCII